MSTLTCIGFDADDTLWHNENYFRLTQERYFALLQDHTCLDHLAARLLEAEKRNLSYYGFGIKGFVLSMIETAIEVTDGKVPGSIIAEILEAGREMLRHPIDLLPDVQKVIETLSHDFKLIMITKGDLLDQERKLAQSGLGDLFDGIEIVSDKTPEIYTDCFTRHGTGPCAALMVGNSMKSDVRPAIEAGAHGVFVPSDTIWELEHAEPPTGHARYHALDTIAQLPDLITRLA